MTEPKSELGWSDTVAETRPLSTGAEYNAETGIWVKEGKDSFIALPGKGVQQPNAWRLSPPLGGGFIVWGVERGMALSRGSPHVSLRAW